MSRRETTLSVPERQRHLIDEFLLLDEWAERYQHLIDLGKRLAPIPAPLRIDRNRVPACRGQTFLAGQRQNNLIVLHASSDTPILAGILALILDVYSGRPPAEILRHPPVLFDRIGLTQNLSPHRRAALLGIHERLIAVVADVEAPRRLAS